jgi:hypothetical protein
MESLRSPLTRPLRPLRPLIPMSAAVIPPTSLMETLCELLGALRRELLPLKFLRCSFKSLVAPPDKPTKPKPKPEPKPASTKVNLM